MKNKKLEKKTLFVFKKNNLTNLTKEQMTRINGGGPTGGNDPSAGVTCPERTVNQTVSE
ncbi:hypothetical protein [Pedobacter alluvionis]|uniref:Uncharacterized protein n=1 Tax=Pedobacter alluvionis TaxID=475253 RepID=A0A497Y2A1_9SPHI|nr:hypothetical protein [Pedobacter alluvionis]RLJ77011.1 hypothetical protein BCL90_2072 [Pedobacter alluvionis]